MTVCSKNKQTAQCCPDVLTSLHDVITTELTAVDKELVDIVRSNTPNRKIMCDGDPPAGPAWIILNLEFSLIEAERRQWRKDCELLASDHSNTLVKHWQHTGNTLFHFRNVTA